MSPEVNSLEWWEDYFKNQWEKNNGRQQTRHFMTRLAESLPEPVRKRLNRQGTTILDWGCALGDGVDVLLQRFPAAAVHGYDFSMQAILMARSYYPQHTFFHPGEPGLLAQYDAVVCSNCLEHFADPLPALASQLRLSRSLHFLLVPYAERDRTPSHKVTLTEESFPKSLDGFTKTAIRIIEVEPRFWSGRQMLVVYQRKVNVLARFRACVSEVIGAGKGGR